MLTSSSHTPLLSSRLSYGSQTQNSYGTLLSCEGAGRARTSDGPGKDNRTARIRFLAPPATESGDGDLLRSQDLPYCDFALLTHASFAGPASASHFSIATLYSASRLSALASCGLQSASSPPPYCIGRDTVDLGVRLALDQLGLCFLDADILRGCRPGRRIFRWQRCNSPVRAQCARSRAPSVCACRRLRLPPWQRWPCPLLPRHRCPWRFRRATRTRPCRSCTAHRRPSPPGCSSPSRSERSWASSSAPRWRRRNPTRR